jgi:hypothetical protein
MKPLRAPWQVWAIVALAPVLWLLYQAPEDPHFSDTARAAWTIGLGLVLLLWGSKFAWVLATAGTGASALVFIYLFFDPSSDQGSIAVLIALTAATLTQFALFVAGPTMDWVGFKDRRAEAPPATPSA